MSASVGSSGPAATPSPTWPLTTIFTPSPSCLPPLVSWSTCTEWQIHNSVVLICGPHTRADHCLPTSFYSNAQTPTFSPGVCPHGYTIATTMTVGGDALSAIPSSVSPTTSLCCPSGLTYRPSIYSGIYNLGVCFTTLTTAGTPQSAELSFQGRVGFVTTDIHDLGTQSSPETVVIGYQSPITVVWASENLAAFTPASAPLRVAASASASVTTSSVSLTTTTSRLTPETHATSTSASLSTGETAGIGVGVAVAVILLCILGVVLWRRHISRNKNKRSSYHEIDKNISGGNELSELDAQRGSTELHLSHKHEMPGSDVGHELDAKTDPTELQSSERYELPGSRHNA